MKTLTFKTTDSSIGQQKFDFLLEFLRGLPDVEIEIQEDTTSDEASRAQEFLKTAGQWADRDIDAADLRQRAWTRANSGS